MAWVGPLLGKSAAADVRPVPIDRRSLPELLERWAPALTLDLPRNAGEPADEVTLELKALKAFSPEGVLAADPELRGLAAVRRTLEALVDEPLELESLARRLEEAGADPSWAARFERELLRTRASGSQPAAATAPAPPGGSGSSLDRLLGMVDGPTAAPPAPSPANPPRTTGELHQLVLGVSGWTGRQRTLEKSAARNAIAEIDRRLHRRLETILHHPEFLALESAWRSLKLLVDRTDFSSGIVLEVLACRRADLLESVERGIFRPEYDSPRDPTLGAVWLDFEFDSTARDIAELDRLARMAESLAVPFIAAAGPAFFGQASSAEVTRLSPLWDTLKRPEFVPWGALREKDASRFLALTFPRVLTRLPYGSGEPVRGLGWSEDPAGSLPWGRGIAALASRVAASHAETGWPCTFTGPAAGGRIEDLPLARVERDPGETALAPLDALVSDSFADELAGAGFVVLAAQANDDAAWIASAPCVRRVEPDSDPEGAFERRREASLAWQLASARVGGVLQRLATRPPESLAPESIRDHFARGLAAGLDLGSDRIAVEVVGDEEQPGAFAVGIHVRLPVLLAGSEIALDLAVRVGR